MTTISIVPEPNATKAVNYRAMAGDRQSVGKTPGEALDALNAQLSESESGTLLVVQQFRPDRFFDERQIARLSALMDRWRGARDQGKTLPAAEQAELEQLVEAELRAATQRAESQSG